MSHPAPKRPEMIFANPPVEEGDTAAPGGEHVQRDTETEAPVKEVAESHQITPYEIAERVYQLMQGELVIERERRGWER